MGYYYIKLDADFHKLYTIVFPWLMVKYKYKRLPMGIKINWILMFFKTSCLSLSKIWNMLRTTCYLDDVLILRNRSFKYHLLKLEMVLASLSTAGMKVSTLISPNLRSISLRLACHLNDFWIMTNRRFKDHLLELQIVVARLSPAGMRLNISKSKFLSEQIEFLKP
jgi:hypothetical protein